MATKQTTETNLEQVIAAGLTSADISSAQLSELISRTEAWISTAAQLAADAEAKALDPMVTPDIKQARAAMEDAQFSARRLSTLLPRLQDKYTETAKLEHYRAFLAEYQEMDAKIAKAAERWIENFPDCITDLAALIEEDRSFAADISRINLNAPSGFSHRLRSPELVARNAPQGTPSILDNLKLVDLDGTIVWPRPQTVDPSLFAPIPFDIRYSPDWWRAGQEARQQQAEQQAHEAEEAEREKNAFYGRPAAE